MSTSRRLLFVLFSDDPCRLNHALLYALDLHREGAATVRLIVEGAATGTMGKAKAEGSWTAELLGQAIEAGLVAGACRTASAGCSTGEPGRQVTDTLVAMGLTLLDDLEGHAGIARFVRDGYEIVPF